MCIKNFHYICCMARMIFKELGHKYGKGKKNYTSVTTLVEQFKPPFLGDHWSSYKIMKKLLPNFFTIKGNRDPKDPSIIEDCLKYVDKDIFLAEKNALKKTWAQNNKSAINRGNRYHAVQEKKSIQRGHQIHPITGKKFETRPPNKTGDKSVALTDYLKDLEDGFYPELLLWNDEHRLAGQADKVFIETLEGVRYVDVDDYKTNSKFTTESYYDKQKDKYSMLLPPLDHLMDCKLMHYELQISAYAWILEQAGYSVRHLCLHHLNEKYDLFYRKYEVEKMLEYKK